MVGNLESNLTIAPANKLVRIIITIRAAETWALLGSKDAIPHSTPNINGKPDEQLQRKFLALSFLSKFIPLLFFTSWFRKRNLKIFQNYTQFSSAFVYVIKII